MTLPVRRKGRREREREREKGRDVIKWLQGQLEPLQVHRAFLCRTFLSVERDISVQE